MNILFNKDKDLTSIKPYLPQNIYAYLTEVKCYPNGYSPHNLKNYNIKVFIARLNL